jgi:hypothetical protein
LPYRSTDIRLILLDRRPSRREDAKEIAMTGDKDTIYLRRRAEEERARADAAADTPARMAHAQLADLYAREANDAGRSASSVPHQDGALFNFIER